jgi:hypothetical protein
MVAQKAPKNFLCPKWLDIIVLGALGARLGRFGPFGATNRVFKIFEKKWKTGFEPPTYGL